MGVYINPISRRHVNRRTWAACRECAGPEVEGSGGCLGALFSLPYDVFWCCLTGALRAACIANKELSIFQQSQ